MLYFGHLFLKISGFTCAKKLIVPKCSLFGDFLTMEKILFPAVALAEHIVSDNLVALC